MDVGFEHFIEYDFEDEASVDDIIQSLQANSHLLVQAAKVLEASVPGLKIEPAKVSVREISKKSPLREVLVVALIMTYQEDLEQEIPALYEALTGQQVSEQYDTLLTVIVMLIAVYTISNIAERIFNRPSEKLKEDADKLLDDASQKAGIKPSAIRQAISDLINGSTGRRIATAARRFFRPVMGRPGASVKSRRGHEISPDAVAEIPSEALLAASDDESAVRTEIGRNVAIELHASDRDRSKRGWAAVVPKFSPDRVRMILDKEISPADLFGRTELRGDVIFVWDKEDDDTEVAKEFHLLVISD